MAIEKSDACPPDPLFELELRWRFRKACGIAGANLLI
jgi:hypothetical protein